MASLNSPVLNQVNKDIHSDNKRKLPKNRLNNTMDDKKKNKHQMEEDNDCKTYNFDISQIPISKISIIKPNENKDFYKHNNFYESMTHSSIIALSKVANSLDIYPQLIKDCLDQHLKISKGHFTFMINSEDLINTNNMIKPYTLFYYIRFKHREHNAIFQASYNERFNVIHCCKKISNKHMTSYTSLNFYNFKTQEFISSDKEQNVSLNNIHSVQSNEHKQETGLNIFNKKTRQNPPKSPKDAIIQYNLKNKDKLRFTVKCRNNPCKYGRFCSFVHNGEIMRCKNEAKYTYCPKKNNCTCLHGISADEYQHLRNTGDSKILYYQCNH